jgi:hypothetical protein
MQKTDSIEITYPAVSRLTEIGWPVKDTDLMRVRGVDGVEWAVKLFKGSPVARTLAGLQSATRGEYHVTAYQTAKHVVLVVGKLSKAESTELAESLAAPISARLRRLENVNAKPALR